MFPQEFLGYSKLNGSTASMLQTNKVDLSHKSCSNNIKVIG